MATLDDVRRAYPGAADIVAAAEGWEDAELVLSLWRQSGVSPVEAAQQYAATDEIQASPRLLQQARHPDFIAWLAAKLGAL